MKSVKNFSSSASSSASSTSSTNSTKRTTSNSTSTANNHKNIIRHKNKNCAFDEFSRYMTFNGYTTTKHTTEQQQSDIIERIKVGTLTECAEACDTYKSW